MNESCHTYEWVMSHVESSQVAHINESRNKYEWVMSHIWMSHVTHMNESCHTYEWVMSHIWKRRGAHSIESCRKNRWLNMYREVPTPTQNIYRERNTHTQTHTLKCIHVGRWFRIVDHRYVLTGTWCRKCGWYIYMYIYKVLTQEVGWDHIYVSIGPWFRKCGPYICIYRDLIQKMWMIYMYNVWIHMYGAYFLSQVPLYICI